VIVTEDLDLFCDTKHHGNSSVSSVAAALPSSLPVLDSKFIAQADSLSKWSDVVACKKRHGHQSVSQVKSAALYNIQTIINGQVLAMDKLTIKQKTMTPVLNTNVTNDQFKDYKVLLLSDNQGRGRAERIKNRLPSNFEVWGLVKPGASSDILNKSVPTETIVSLLERILLCYGKG
jgi:hypothetical protein